MQTWIVLFRGINVGGNNRLLMAELKGALKALGLKNIRTYIQSGNVVLDSDQTDVLSLKSKIAASVEKLKGFRPKVFLLTASDLKQAVESNPFPKEISDPKTLHFLFLSKAATNANTKTIEEIKVATESYHLTDTVFYLHAPDGIGRSKLAAQVEKLLGVATTGRNYRTIEKLMAMIEPQRTLV
jgi:uncharacterized protein (DUF1697 family)